MAVDDPDRFAAQLRALKDASGLSYGVLARRLGVSPSTLHRYANAESVPARFELVERYARLCGADPQDRLDLHRHWLLADAARRTERRPPAGPTAGLQPTAIAEPDVQPVRPGPDRPAEDLPDALPGRPARPRSLVVAAAAVLAASVLGAGAAAVVGNWWRPTGTATVAAPAAAGPVTVRATAEPYLWGGRCSPRYLIDRPPNLVPLPPPPSQRDAWVRALDGIPVGQQLLKVTVTTDASGVVLDSLRAEVRSLGPVEYRNAFVAEPGCGPAPALPSYFADLDGRTPTIVPSSGQPGFPLLVSGGTPTVFYVRASAEWHQTVWVLQLRWSSGSRRGVLQVDDRGIPFRVSGPGGVGTFEPVPGHGWLGRPPSSD